MLLHGLGASSRYWEGLAETTSHYAAVAPDLLGFAGSPTPPHVSYDAACHLEREVLISPPQGGWPGDRVGYLSAPSAVLDVRGKGVGERGEW